MDEWGYQDEEKIFCIRPLQLKRRYALPPELYDELGKPSEVRFEKIEINKEGGKVEVIVIKNSEKDEDGETIDTAKVETTGKSSRRISVPKKVIDALEYNGNTKERIAVFKCKRNSHKTIEVVNLNINSIK